jgi:hypothetical protein
MKDRYDVLVIGGGAAGVGAAVGARPQRDVLGTRLRQSNCGRRREPARGDANMGERTVGHTSKTRHQKRPPETGGRNGASIAACRRRPALLGTLVI